MDRDLEAYEFNGHGPELDLLNPQPVPGPGPGPHYLSHSHSHSHSHSQPLPNQQQHEHQPEVEEPFVPEPELNLNFDYPLNGPGPDPAQLVNDNLSNVLDVDLHSLNNSVSTSTISYSQQEKNPKSQEEADYHTHPYSNLFSNYFNHMDTNNNSDFINNNQDIYQPPSPKHNFMFNPHNNDNSDINNNKSQTERETFLPFGLKEEKEMESNDNDNDNDNDNYSQNPSDHDSENEKAKAKLRANTNNLRARPINEPFTTKPLTSDNQGAAPLNHIQIDKLNRKGNKSKTNQNKNKESNNNNNGPSPSPSALSIPSMDQYYYYYYAQQIYYYNLHLQQQQQKQKKSNQGQNQNQNENISLPNSVQMAMPLPTMSMPMPMPMPMPVPMPMSMSMPLPVQVPSASASSSASVQGQTFTNQISFDHQNNEKKTKKLSSQNNNLNNINNNNNNNSDNNSSDDLCVSPARPLKLENFKIEPNSLNLNNNLNLINNSNITLNHLFTPASLSSVNTGTHYQNLDIQKSTNNLNGSSDSDGNDSNEDKKSRSDQRQNIFLPPTSSPSNGSVGSVSSVTIPGSGPGPGPGAVAPSGSESSINHPHDILSTDVNNNLIDTNNINLSRKRKAKMNQAEDSMNNVNVIVNGNLPGNVNHSMSSLESKRLDRLERNRASAQLSRERKKEYIRTLEKQIKELELLNENLTNQLTIISNENIALKHQLSLKSILRPPKRLQNLKQNNNNNNNMTQPILQPPYFLPNTMGMAAGSSAFGPGPLQLNINIQPKGNNRDEYNDGFGSSNTSSDDANTSPISPSSPCTNGPGSGSLNTSKRLKLNDSTLDLNKRITPSSFVLFSLVITFGLFFGWAGINLLENEVEIHKNHRSNNNNNLSVKNNVVDPHHSTHNLFTQTSNHRGRLLASVKEEDFTIVTNDNLLNQTKTNQTLSKSLVPLSDSNDGLNSQDKASNFGLALDLYSPLPGGASQSNKNDSEMKIESLSLVPVSHSHSHSIVGLKAGVNGVLSLPFPFPFDPVNSASLYKTLLNASNRTASDDENFILCLDPIFPSGFNPFIKPSINKLEPHINTQLVDSNSNSIGPESFKHLTPHLPNKLHDYQSGHKLGSKLILYLPNSELQQAFDTSNNPGSQASNNNDTNKSFTKDQVMESYLVEVECVINKVTALHITNP